MWTGKNWFNFGTHQLLYPELGIFEEFFNIARLKISPQFGSYL